MFIDCKVLATGSLIVKIAGNFLQWVSLTHITRRVSFSNEAISEVMNCLKVNNCKHSNIHRHWLLLFTCTVKTHVYAPNLACGLESTYSYTCINKPINGDSFLIRLFLNSVWVRFQGVSLYICSWIDENKIMPRKSAPLQVDCNKTLKRLNKSDRISLNTELCLSCTSNNLPLKCWKCN